MNYYLLRSNLTCVIFSISFLSNAQNIWLDHHPNSVSISLYRPFFDEYKDFNFPSLGISLYGKYSIGDKENIVVDVPFAYGGFEGYSQRGSDSMNTLQIGNIYVGLEIEHNNRSFLTEFGIRFPIFSSDVKVTDIIKSSNYDQIESYEEFFLGMLAAKTNYFLALNNAVQFRVRVGINLFVDFSQTLEPENRLLGDYATQVIYTHKLLNAKAGLSGQIWITADDLEDRERIINSLGLGADFNLGKFVLKNFSPGIGLKLPLSKRSEMIPDAVMSIILTQRF